MIVYLSRDVYDECFRHLDDHTFEKFKKMSEEKKEDKLNILSETDEED